MELQGRLIPKVLDSDRGAVIKFFKQRNYCFPKQIVSGRRVLDLLFHAGFNFSPLDRSHASFHTTSHPLSSIYM